ncbi:hypothetical protein M413DRAFT_420222 [Hebeloma cylindrosporum]|uniref:Radical SAM core domain-containing protein n=1 Tax=Hebeloma cylindrosporum TaxID=76867 RepID=A0A0C3BP66_HEBCY|nr:hypothetical protein M413DRAFT_420222 [Hebeloma cylindrosporum h7]
MNRFKSWLPSLFISYPEPHPDPPVSVNWFPNRRCNYECAFCFHTTKNTFILPIDKAKLALRLLSEAGMKKLNISGGEPFLNPKHIGEIFKFCKEELKLEATSVVCNGSKVTEKWLNEYGQYLDVMAISCDSFNSDTNEKQGRRENGKGDNHIGKVQDVAALCKRHGIRVKINSVITINNWQEDMNDHISEIDPFRWKVFQVLLLDGENTGAETGSLRDARNLIITTEQFQSFLERHKSQPSLVAEDNEAMKDSYLNLDEEMRYEGWKKPGRSILDVGVAEALRDSGFDYKTFIDRGGIYDWGRTAQPPIVDW